MLHVELVCFVALAVEKVTEWIELEVLMANPLPILGANPNSIAIIVANPLGGSANGPNDGYRICASFGAVIFSLMSQK